MAFEGRNNPPVVAVVGATGAVGIEMIGCLERRRFPLNRGIASFLERACNFQEPPLWS